MTGYADGGRDEETEGTLVVRRIRWGEAWEGGKGWHLPRRPGKCDCQKYFFFPGVSSRHETQRGKRGKPDLSPLLACCFLFYLLINLLMKQQGSRVLD